MKCPKCGGRGDILDCRETDYGKRRKHECLQCKHRFQTVELLKRDYDAFCLECLKKVKTDKIANIDIAKALLEANFDNDDLIEIAKHLLVFTDERKGR